MRFVVAAVFVSFSVAQIAACSSDSTGPGSPSTGDGGGGGDAASSCGCSVSVNGDAKKIACGGDDCVGGKPYHCGDGASLTQGGTGCTAPKDAGGGTDSSSQTATTVPCKQFPPAPQTCDAKTQYCIISKPNGGEVCAPLPSGCSACPCATSDTEAAWKKAKNGTINCTNAVIACNDANGAITTTCQK
jgi:hypothetical protein